MYRNRKCLFSVSEDGDFLPFRSSYAIYSALPPFPHVRRLPFLFHSIFRKLSLLSFFFFASRVLKEHLFFPPKHDRFPIHGSFILFFSSIFNEDQGKGFFFLQLVRIFFFGRLGPPPFCRWSVEGVSPGPFFTYAREVILNVEEPFSPLPPSPVKVNLSSPPLYFGESCLFSPFPSPR